MKKLTLLFLAFALPLGACTADENPAAANEVAQQTEAQIAAAARLAPEPAADGDANKAEPVRVAQAAPAQSPVAGTFKEGEHYQRLTPAQPTSSDPATVEVAEVFMYTCPHCATFEPFISEWSKGKGEGVSFVRLPASFNEVAALHLRTYYVAETLGILEDMHQVLFDEIHVRKNMMRSENDIAAVFARHGVDRAKFDSTWSSFAVDSKMRRAETLARRYRINSVPTIVVNGKYKTDGRMAGSYPRLIQIIDYLVQQEQAGAAQPVASN